jgi:transposase
MRNRGGKTYRPWEPQRYRQEAHSPAAKLPEGDLVFFLIDTVSRLDLRRFYAPYEDETRGAPPFDPAMMVCLLLYAYCVGMFSSRKIALACERNLAFVAMVGSERPDFRTISDFRKRHLEAFIDVFVAVVRLAGEAGLVKLGNVSTDGTKIQGNASRHKAMSYGYMKREVERLREDIEALVTQAYQQDEAEEAALGSRRGDELPAELARREERLATIEAAMRRLEARAKLTPSVSAAPRRRRSANGQARNAAARCRSLWKRPLRTTRRATSPTLSSTSCKRTTKAGSTAATRKSVWTRPVRSSWPVMSPMRQMTNSRRSRWPKRRWRPWPRRVLRPHRTSQAQPKRSRRPWTMAITVRGRRRHWRT